MSDTSSLSYSDRVIEIGSPQQKIGFVSLFLTLLVFLVVVSLFSFGGGYLIGQIEINQPQIKKLTGSTKTIDQKDGNSLFSDSNAKFSVTFPSTWKVTSKKTGIKGATIENSEASVELWLLVDQPVALNDEQKAGVQTTKQIQLTVDQQTINATEYIYTAGNFLTTAQLPASKESSKVTFLIKARDKNSYDAAKQIAQSFKFTK